MANRSVTLHEETVFVEVLWGVSPTAQQGRKSVESIRLVTVGKHRMQTTNHGG
jgi:hypothetical protein